MTATNLKLAVGALIVAGLGMTALLQHRTQERLLRENRTLHQKVAQLDETKTETQRMTLNLRRPAPALPVRGPSIEPALTDPQSTNILSGLFKGGSPNLSLQQVENYLAQNQRSAESLLAAFRLTGTGHCWKRRPRDTRKILK
jgi:hypothetical protein